jgi:precorrin-2/cobalt-factor-2 C20-methyltransferase
VNTTGTLYGVGVGPGAPDLLTLRAVDVLGHVEVILAAASPNNDYSAALNAARPYLRPDARILRLEFPMTRRKDSLREAWNAAAQKVREVLEGGENAAFLTIGDPLIYSTFGYLLRTLQESAPVPPVRIVPGITSFQAAAARTATVLCEGVESLRILSGLNDEEELFHELEGADTVALLKVYRNAPAVAGALRRAGRGADCLLASHVECAGERLVRGIGDVNPDIADASPPYMSLILSRKP